LCDVTKPETFFIMSKKQNRRKQRTRLKFGKYVMQYVENATIKASVEQTYYLKEFDWN
jgi:hypothetical protein